MKDLKKLSNILVKINDEASMEAVLKILFTEKELESVVNRINIIDMLQNNIPQAKIAKKIGVGIATVTRGASVIKKYKHFNWWKDFLSWRN